LVKADLHGILDCLEEPEETAKQAVREMEAAIEVEEASLRELDATIDRLEREASELARTQSEIERQIELCFSAGNEELAKSFVRKRLEGENRGRALNRSKDEALKRAAKCKATITQHREELAAITHKLSLFSDAKKVACEASTSACARDWCVTEQEVEASFLAEKQRRAKKSEE
jgi:phage shock protein A